MTVNNIIKKGNIYLIDFGVQQKSIQSGIRPAIVTSFHINNKFSPTLNVLPITSKDKTNIPVHVSIGTEFGLKKQSIVLTEQIATINKSQIIKFIGRCNKNKMLEIERAMLIQSGIDIYEHLHMKDVV